MQETINQYKNDMQRLTAKTVTKNNINDLQNSFKDIQTLIHQQETHQKVQNSLLTDYTRMVDIGTMKKSKSETASQTQLSFLKIFNKTSKSCVSSIKNINIIENCLPLQALITAHSLHQPSELIPFDQLQTSLDEVIDKPNIGKLNIQQKLFEVSIEHHGSYHKVAMYNRQLLDSLSFYIKRGNKSDLSCLYSTMSAQIFGFTKMPNQQNFNKHFAD